MACSRTRVLGEVDPVDAYDLAPAYCELEEVGPAWRTANSFGKLLQAVLNRVALRAILAIFVPVSDLHGLRDYRGVYFIIVVLVVVMSQLAVRRHRHSVRAA